MNVTVEKEQNIFDIVLAKYGTLDETDRFREDNDLTFNSKLNSGQVVVVNNSGVGNERIKKAVTLQKIVYNNNQGETVPPLVGGDFNISFAKDFY
tara:strand:- start:1068 stop:1352 length:285 start_codon:yes stop_codon:yes gene_type:complete